MIKRNIFLHACITLWGICNIYALKNIYAENITSRSLNLIWSAGLEGTIGYRIKIIPKDYLYSTNCGFNKEKPVILEFGNNVTNAYIDSLNPYQQFQIEKATKYSFGNQWSRPLFINTLPEAPERVRSISYLIQNNSVVIAWEMPCKSNGELSYFKVVGTGIKDSKILESFNKIVNVTKGDSPKVYEFKKEDLMSNVSYEIKIAAYNKESQHPGIKLLSFRSPEKLPNKPQQSQMLSVDPQSKGPTKVSVKLTRNMFGYDTKVLYYALLLGEKGYTPEPTQKWLDPDKEWPIVKTWKEASIESNIPLYQATPYKWNPFDGDHTSIREEYILGHDSFCDNLNESTYCNGALRVDTEYSMIIRAFSKCGFTDSPQVFFSTVSFNFSIVYTLISVVVIGLIIALLFVYVRNRQAPSWKTLPLHFFNTAGIIRNIPNLTKMKRKTPTLSLQGISVEYERLEKHSSKIKASKKVAAAEKNKSKNRYGNILPYDFNRVILNTSENYINASLIEEGDSQFIACQGPKENTTDDFWAMIYIMRVKVIVMLCKAIEKDKVKCHTYFPEENQITTYGEYGVCCTQRTSNISYIVRDITLVKDGHKQNITHLQFLDWPDFGVPPVRALLYFSKIVQNIYEPINKCENGPLVVHCSAGVGRSGTFIALYTMLKTKTTSIDIYNLVTSLRNQRAGMVQTLNQYQFLYQCLDFIKEQE